MLSKNMYTVYVFFHTLWVQDTVRTSRGLLSHCCFVGKLTGRARRCSRETHPEWDGPTHSANALLNLCQCVCVWLGVCCCCYCSYCRHWSECTGSCIWRMLELVLVLVPHEVASSLSPASSWNLGPFTSRNIPRAPLMATYGHTRTSTNITHSSHTKLPTHTHSEAHPTTTGIFVLSIFWYRLSNWIKLPPACLEEHFFWWGGNTLSLSKQAAFAFFHHALASIARSQSRRRSQFLCIWKWC